MVNFWPVFPLLFANGLGIYLTSFSLSVPLRPPCEAIQSPETPSPSHRIEALQGKRPPGWGKVLRRRSRGASPAWEKVAFQAGPCHCQLWDSTDGSFQASFSSL